MTTTDSVRSIYEAFGRGDLAHILGKMRDDIRWDEGVRDTSLPYLQPGTGTAHVAGFFEALRDNVEFSVFDPGPICGDDHTVIAVVREAGRNLKTGAPLAEDLSVHIWTFDDEGKIASFRHVADWAVHEAAARASVSATR